MNKKLLMTVGFSVMGFTLFTIFNSTNVFAASCSWNGSSSANWSDTGNWDPGCAGVGGIPDTGDLLTFPLGAGNQAMNNDIVGLTIGDMTFEDSYTLVGNDLTVNVGVNATVAGTVISLNIIHPGSVSWVADADLVMNGDVDTNGDFDLDTSAGSGTLEFNGTITGNAGINVMSGSNVLLTGTNTFVGDVLIEGNLFIENGSALGDAANIPNITTDGVLFLNGGITVPNAFLINGISGAIDNINSANTISGNITLDSPLLINIEASHLTLSGDIVGDAGITLSGPTGLLTFSGTGSNTFDGDLVINEGIVEMAKVAPSLVNASIVVGNAVGAADTATLVSIGDQLPSIAVVTVNSDGLFDLDGNNEEIDTLNIADGHVDFNGGDLTVTGDTTLFGGNININAGTFFLDGDLIGGSGDSQGVVQGGTTDLGSGNHTISSTAGDFVPDLLLLGVLSGSGTITYSATAAGAEIGLDAANTYTGPSVINGTVYVMTNAGLGTTAGNTTVNANAVLHLYQNRTIAENIQLGGTGIGAFGAIDGESFTSTLTGTITLLTDAKITSLGGGTMNLNGVISGSHNLAFAKSGGMGLSGFLFGAINTFVGNVSVVNSTLTNNNSSGSIPDTTIVDIDAASTLNFATFDDIIGGLTGTGIWNFGAQGGTIDTAVADTFDGTLVGSGNILKEGVGTLTLTTASPSFTGQLIINEGKVLVNADLSDVDVSIQTGAILGGNGTVNTIVSTGGTLSPGNSPAIMNVGGNLALDGNTVTIIELNGTTAGTGYDQFIVTGNVDLASSTLNVSLGFVPTTGNTFTIISSTGVIIGTFNGLADGATFVSGGVTFRINYTTTTVVLTVTAAPLANTGIDMPVAVVFMVTVIAGISSFVLLKKRKNFTR